MTGKPTEVSKFTLYPLAWLSAGFAAGILLASRCVELSANIYFAFALFTAILAFICRRRRRKMGAAVFLLIFSVAAGALCFEIEKNSIAANRLKILYDKGELVSGDPVEITGILRGRPESAVGGFFLILQAETVVYKNQESEVSGSVRLFAPTVSEQIAGEYERLNLSHGARLRVACELRREEKFRNPGFVSRVEILDQREIDATATIKSPLLVENLGGTKIFRPAAWVFERRQELIREFKNHFSLPTAGVLIASLLGNRYYLDKATMEKFREGGTLHVLVISGLQITFIGMLAVWLIQIFTRNRVLQFALASIFLWSYSLAVGADAPVLRAAVMFTILLFARVIFRQATLLNALGAAALILLLRRPSDLFDQSFQLTFVCLTAIVATALPLLEKLRAVGEWRPSAETPAPPIAGKNLRAFCEALYWSEENWRREQARSVWSCRLFKVPLAEKLEKLKLQKIFRFVFQTLIVSVAVQAWLLPLLVVYFHRVSVIGIFLNIWVGLLMAIESIAAIVAVLAAQISGTLAAPLILLTEVLNRIIVHAADLFIAHGWASFRAPRYSGWAAMIYVLYFAPVISLTYYLHKWKPFSPESSISTSKFKIRSALASFAVFLYLILFHPFSAPRPDGRLRVEFLDVGQGDAALLTMPTGETLLVDGGGNVNFNALYVRREGEEEEEEPELFEPDAPSVGEAVVSEFLWEKGYSQVDFILATHADADHIQGLTDVAKNFRVRAAIFGRAPFEDQDFAELFHVLERRGVPSLLVSRGERLNFDDVSIEVLYPIRDDSPRAASDNNHSLVLRVNFGERRFLLTGDIERETEKYLLEANDDLRADVVKVAHHGSRTSSSAEFVAAAKAKVAVVSAGRDSPFGHPKPEIVERWKESGAKVLTTGENGTISFSTDGKDLQLKTFLKPTTFR
jgi:competence protein ComEC